MPGLKFLSREPALLAGDSLIISDLHIGIEHEYWQSGMKVPSQTDAMKKRIDALLRSTRAKRLLVCGDFKHKVPGVSYQEQKEIPEFLEHFSKKVRIEIAQGNHDADLKPLIPNKKIILHPTKGFLKENLYLTHGHTWPSKDFLKADFIVMGHVQPQVEIKDKLGYVWREQVWARAALDKKKISEKYEIKKEKFPELIILPSFNPLAGGLALNKKEDAREHLSPLLKLANLGKAKIYLLDGTFLGTLQDL